ncbi:hypothetical protein A500_10530 [Clostridium sartagoforme AAU1]|uniref:DUF2577 domain-containing protein n=1 Tax=Clostridium sartagoforme AAU1 TaxID=1202534 RepID=R9CDL0_9CLOT|nr:DUF2577 domain-containing protein [Clostridium sartagoforme]EOR25306.1 hypothetical protein A500_10530 [Clostridium sartagoforme AAU1]
MANSSDLIMLIRSQAIGAVNASNPTAIVYGKVISIAPLKIQVDQKMTLTKEFLILTRNVKDHKVFMTVDHATEYKSGGSGDASFESHNHAYKGKKEFTIHNGLVVGDEVIMIQMQGGQKFLVIDKL